MQVFLTLFRRELGNYFLSMIGYIIIAAVMFLTGYSFVVLLIKLQQVPTPMPITVTIGTPAFLSACLSSTERVATPLALAVRM